MEKLQKLQINHPKIPLYPNWVDYIVKVPALQYFVIGSNYQNIYFTENKDLRVYS